MKKLNGGYHAAARLSSASPAAPATAHRYRKRSPTAAEQQVQVEEVLRELESQDKPRIYVMNKVDLLPEKKNESLRDTDSVIHVSAAKGTGLDKLLELIDAKIAEDPVQTVRLRVPQSEGKALAALDAKSVILSREYRDGYVELEVEAPESLLRRMKAFVTTN